MEAQRSAPRTRLEEHELRYSTVRPPVPKAPLKRRLLLAGALALSLLAGAASVDVVRIVDVAPPVYARGKATLEADPWIKRVIHHTEYELAMNHAKLCLANDPQNYQCHRALGIVYARLGQEDAAVREYRAARKLEARNSPNDIRYHTDVDYLLARHDYRFMD